METWALANQKGGTGKTTTAIHLCAALSNKGKRCLLVDLDPQAHATLGTGIAVEAGPTIADAFLENRPLEKLVRVTGSGFHMIPADERLAEFEEIAERSLQPEGILASALRPLAARYDWVVLDCPPRADGVLTANAIRAATTTLLVVETGAFAMRGALRAREIFTARARALGRDPELVLLATMFERDSRLASEFLIALQARFGHAMLDTVIRRDEALREAVAYGVPVSRLHPTSGAVVDFDALADEVLTRRPALTSDRPSPRVTSSPPAVFRI